MRLVALLCVAVCISLVPVASAGQDPGEGRYETLFTLAVDKPGGLAFDGELLWVSDRLGIELHGVDPSTGEKRISLPSPGPYPGGLAFDGELLWVADRSRDRIFGLDLSNRLVVREVESPPNPLGMAFDGTYLWVADGRKLHQVSREDGTTIVSFDAPPFGGQGRAGEQLGLAWTDGVLWVSDRKADRLYRVDPVKGDVLHLMPSPGSMPSGLAVVGDRLVIADVERRHVDALDIDSMAGTVRSEPRKEEIVLRRSVTNRGPGTMVESEILVAIPRDLPSQDLESEPVFNPTPDGIVEDRWGQRFARFVARDLPPGASQEITMTVRATLYATRLYIDPEKVGNLNDIPAEAAAYLEDAAKFALDHPSIRRHLKDALNGEDRVYWMLRKIARYIQDRMHYELAGGWNIAPTVIDRGSGSCSEYTFVFISMCRAAGIPARYAGAVVVRGDDGSTDEVFHRWAEVFLPGYGWVTYDVQAGDKPAPEKQAEVFGGLSNRFLITTLGGGGSRYIGWDYNSTARWKCSGRCDVADLHLGDWYPAEESGPKP